MSGLHRKLPALHGVCKNDTTVAHFDSQCIMSKDVYQIECVFTAITLHGPPEYQMTHTQVY